MPAMADRQAQRALLQEQWDSLDDLTSRLSQRVRERPNRDVEEGPGHLPDPNVAQELILTRGRLAAVEKERDKLERRLEATKQKLRATRIELRRDRRHLERLGAVAPSPRTPREAPAEAPPAPGREGQAAAELHVVHAEPDAEFEGAPLPEAGIEPAPPDLVDRRSTARESELAAEVAELNETMAQLDDLASVLTAVEGELAEVAEGADGAAPHDLGEGGDATDAEPAAPRPVRRSARGLFSRISARWRGRGPGAPD